MGLDRTNPANDNTGNPNNNVTGEVLPKPGEGNLPTGSRPDTSAPHLPGVELVSNQVQIDKDPDGKPKAFHSNGFSFEHHDDGWYYHQDSGGKYVRINEPHVNDDGSVTAYERGLFNNGREHKLVASGETTESELGLAERHWGQGVNQIIDIGGNTVVSHVAGDWWRGNVKTMQDLKNGDPIAAVGDFFQRNANMVDDVISEINGNKPTRAWTLGQQLQTDVANGNMDQFKRDLNSVNALWDGTSYGGTTRGDERFYDDNNWIGIALVDAYKKDPTNPESQAYLDQAKKVFEYVKTGEEGTDKLQPAGGVFWQQGQPYRSAVSTAGAEQLALSLYQQTGDKQYLDFAVRQQQWMDSTLKQDNGLYRDGVDPNGSTEQHKDQWSYNQGLMLGNATMLYQATGDKKYLDEAQQIAKDSLKAFGKDGAERDFTDQNVHFNAVFFKNLMQLDAIAPDNSYRQALAKYNYDVTSILASGRNDGVYENAVLTRASAQQVALLAQQYPPA